VRLSWGSDACAPAPRALARAPPPRAALAAAAAGLLPALVRNAAHPFKTLRRDVHATVFSLLEAGFLPCEGGGGGAFPPPAPAPWRQWAAPLLAALLLPLPAAARTLAAEGGKGAADRTPGGFWAENALLGAMYLAYEGLDTYTPLSAPLSLLLLPPLLLARGLPDKDNAALAERVASGLSNTVCLFGAGAAPLDASFLGDVEAAVEVAAGGGGGGGGGGAPLPAPTPPAAALAAILAAWAREGGAGGEAGGRGGALTSALLRAAAGGGEAPSWTVRRAALKAAAAAFGSQWLALPRAHAAALRAVAEAALAGDSAPEVSEAAAEALVGFHIASSPGARERAARALAAALAAPAARAPSRVPPPAAPVGTDAHAAEAAAHRAFKVASAAASRARLAVALGAGALLRAHPFDVPPYLPPALALLTRLANAPKPVGVAAQRALAEFRHLHNDMWDLHKLAFSEELAVEIMQAGSGTTYFA
jgi:hypothetical protein